MPSYKHLQSRSVAWFRYIWKKIRIIDILKLTHAEGEIK